VTLSPAEARLTTAHGRIALVGIVLLVALGALVWLAPQWSPRLQAAWFDTYQRLFPRRIDATPVVIVEIDEGSVRRLGQWPWPRTVLAELVRAIQRMQPVAIGIDIVMPDADRLSPDVMLAEVARGDAALASRLASLPSGDRELARAVTEGPVVLAFVGTDKATGRAPRAPPFVVVDPAAGEASSRASAVPAYAGAVTNIEALDAAAQGHGAISSGSSEEIVRRLPLVVRIGDSLAPSFALEILRLALGATDVRVLAHGPAIRAVRVGDFVAATEPDSAVRIHYSRHDQRRFRSAAAVLGGVVDAPDLQHKIVLISATAVALGDQHDTPLGERMPGSEIQAQLLENLYGGSALVRPAWAGLAELAAFVVLGAVLIAATPRLRPAHASLLAVACVVLVIGAGIAAFVAGRLVLDAAHPSLALVALYGALLALALGDARRVRRSLEHVVRAQREEAAYIAGELDAAKRIQAGYLPRVDVLRDEARVDVAAAMLPAREVGGDLYDFFRLDDDRIFFLIGDVAGKGLSASLFMAVSKALCKSAALRHRGASIGELMRIADDEVSRDNAEMRFVAAFAGLLDLRSGELAYCNAGHENPYRLGVDAARPDRLDDGGGPPLGAVEHFAYRGSAHRMRAGETLCLVTDGVADAQDRRNEHYGKERLEAILAAWSRAPGTARSLVDAVCDDVRAFSSGRDLADDVTVLAVRWIGPGAPP
jgi:CHASE2 domain-containing sensor protein/serine phosphatase RsbU (regulator of sigma subunit)